jgi:hypothetical protein
MELSLCLIKHHATKTYGGARYNSTILDLGTRCGWVVSFMCRPLYSQYPLDRRRWEPVPLWTLYRRKKIAHICWESNLDLSACRTLLFWVIPADYWLHVLYDPTLENSIFCPKCIMRFLWLTSPKSGGRSVGIVRLRTRGHRVFCLLFTYVDCIMRMAFTMREHLVLLSLVDYSDKSGRSVMSTIWEGVYITTLLLTCHWK